MQERASSKNNQYSLLARKGLYVDIKKIPITWLHTPWARKILNENEGIQAGAQITSHSIKHSIWFH